VVADHNLRTFLGPGRSIDLHSRLFNKRATISLFSIPSDVDAGKCLLAAGNS
jgi:hypothetical protein